jgi:hypothetical protein
VLEDLGMIVRVSTPAAPYYRQDALDGSPVLLTALPFALCVWRWNQLLVHDALGALRKLVLPLAVG